MQANDLFKYRDKIIYAFKDGTFQSQHQKRSDDAANDYVLKIVNKSIEEIKSMKEKINLSLSEEFFEYSPTDYAKILINIKNQDENRKTVEEIKIRFKRQNKRNKRKRKKDKNVNETLEIIEKILNYNKDAQKFFYGVSKVQIV